MDNNEKYDALEKEIVKELANRDRDNSGGESSAIMESQQQRMSVLLRTITAIKDDNEFRQLLLLADFLDDEEAETVAAAITEAQRYGASLGPILNYVTAKCAVNKNRHGKSRVAQVIEGLTHSTFTTVNQGQNKRGIFNRENNNERTNEQ